MIRASPDASATRLPSESTGRCCRVVGLPGHRAGDRLTALVPHQRLEPDLVSHSDGVIDGCDDDLIGGRRGHLDAQIGTHVPADSGQHRGPDADRDRIAAAGLKSEHVRLSQLQVTAFGGSTVP